MQKLRKLNLENYKLLELPNEIVNLTNLRKIIFIDNPKLILTTEQKEWIERLKNNGCTIISFDELKKHLK